MALPRLPDPENPEFGKLHVFAHVAMLNPEMWTFLVARPCSRTRGRSAPDGRAALSPEQGWSGISLRGGRSTLGVARTTVPLALTFAPMLRVPGLVCGTDVVDLRAPNANGANHWTALCPGLGTPPGRTAHRPPPGTPATDPAELPDAPRCVLGCLATTTTRLVLGCRTRGTFTTRPPRQSVAGKARDLPPRAMSDETLRGESQPSSAGFRGKATGELDTNAHRRALSIAPSRHSFRAGAARTPLARRSRATPAELGQARAPLGRRHSGDACTPLTCRSHVAHAPLARRSGTARRSRAARATLGTRTRSSRIGTSMNKAPCQEYAARHGAGEKRSAHDYEPMIDAPSNLPRNSRVRVAERRTNRSPCSPGLRSLERCPADNTQLPIGSAQPLGSPPMGLLQTMGWPPPMGSPHPAGPPPPMGSP